METNDHIEPQLSLELYAYNENTLEKHLDFLCFDHCRNGVLFQEKEMVLIKESHSIPQAIWHSTGK